MERLFILKPNKNILYDTKYHKKITKIHQNYKLQEALSDSRLLAKSPGLELGLRNKTMHQIDEKTSVKDLKKLTKYIKILQNYFK